MEYFYLRSFGCKVNQYDGQGLRERLLGTGLRETASPERADLMVVNFCVVTGRSASRCFRALKSLSRRRPGAALVAAGCLSPKDRARALEACPGLLFLDSDDPSGVLKEAMGQDIGTEAFVPVGGLEGHTRTFVKIQDGCNLSCAYCIIPSIRGRERSRPPEAVLEEVGRLLDCGFKELVLCGIRLGGYRWEGSGLGHLLERVLTEYPGAYRLRLSSLNPAEVSPKLLEVMARDARVARHLHLPLQSGDPQVLKWMRRPYSPRQYLNKIGEVRRALPDPAISTDLMVGYPGEDEAAFRASMDLLQEAGVSRVHVFPYSPREGTEAARQPQVPDGVKTRRAQEAVQAGQRLKEAFDRSFIGRKAEVLLEAVQDNGRGRATGLTSRYQKTLVTGFSRKPGRNVFVEVILNDFREGLLLGCPAAEDRNG